MRIRPLRPPFAALILADKTTHASNGLTCHAAEMQLVHQAEVGQLLPLLRCFIFTRLRYACTCVTVPLVQLHVGQWYGVVADS